MTYIVPPQSKLKINENGIDTVITVKPDKNWFTTIFLGFWLIGWLIGEVLVGSILLGSLFIKTDMNLEFGKLFIIAWLGMWTVGGFFALKTFLWQIIGREIITLNSQEMKIKRDFGIYKNEKSYGREYIKDMRIIPTDNNPFRSFSFGNSIGSKIAFDYGAKTVKFGVMKDEAEAKNLLEIIRTRFPSYFAG